MKARNPIGYMASPGRGGKGTTEHTGKFVRGPNKGRVGHAKGGKVKRGRRY